MINRSVCQNVSARFFAAASDSARTTLGRELSSRLVEAQSPASWVERTGDVVGTLWNFAMIEAGYVVTAVLVHDVMAKSVYWTVTIYTVTRAAGCLLAFVCAMYWAGTRQVYGSNSVLLVIFAGVGNLMCKLIGQIL